MVRSFGDYEDLVEAIPAVPREVSRITMMRTITMILGSS